MKKEIKKLFPTNFGVNENEEMVAEITLSNLNKIIDYIIEQEQKINLIVKIVGNEKITGVESKLMIQDILKEK